MGADSHVKKCADDVRELADDQRFAARRDDLVSLADDVANPDGDRWAGIDLFRAFPVDETPRLQHRNALEIVLGMLAGVAVFLPVGWTWWSLHEATGAYESLIAASGEPEGTTFLALWTTGFEGRLDGFHRLVPMAMVSVILILFAVLCLVAHRAAAGINVRREERAQHEARAQLLRVLTAASLVLQYRRADHPQRIEHIIKSSLETLSAAHDSARGVLEKLELSTSEVGKSLTSLVDNVKSATDEAQKLVTSSQSAAEAARAASEQTKITLDHGSSVLRAVLEQGVRELESASASAGEQVADEITGAISRFEGSTVGAVDSASTVRRGLVGDIRGSVATSGAASQQLADNVAGLSSQQEQARRDLESAIARIEDVLLQFDRTLGRHQSTLQAQADDLNRARDAAERMLTRLTVAANPLAGS